MDGLLKGMKSRVGQLKNFLGGVAHTISALTKEAPSKIQSQLTTAKKDESATQKQVNQATQLVNKLKGDRSKEESQIKKLVAERAAEYEGRKGPRRRSAPSRKSRSNPSRSSGRRKNRRSKRSTPP